MKSILISILLTLPLLAQSVANEVVLTSTAILFGISSGLTEGYRLEQTYNPFYDDEQRTLLNKKWHDWKFISQASLMGLGIEIGIISEQPIPILIDVFSSAVIFWFLHDGVINKVRGFNWFRQADIRFNRFERFATPEIKISLLFIVVILKVLKYSL